MCLGTWRRRRRRGAWAALLVALALGAGAARAETRLLGVQTTRDASGGVRVVLRADAALPEAMPFALEAQ